MQAHFLAGTAVMLTLAGSTMASPDWWPVIQPGNWQTRMVIGGRNIDRTTCLTQEMVAQMNILDQSNSQAKQCDAPTFSHEGNTFVARISCRDGQYVVRHLVVDKDTHHLETTRNFKGQAPQTMISEMRYLGICSGQVKNNIRHTEKP